MKLPIPQQSLNEMLREFDVWITPSLGEIRDTDRFREEMARVVSVLNALEPSIVAAQSPNDFAPSKIATTFLAFIDQADEQTAKEILQSLASLLFLITGKSDNNAKTQLPHYLMHSVGWKVLIDLKVRRNEIFLTQKPIPRVLNSKSYMGHIAKFCKYPDKSERDRTQRRLLEQYIAFVLSDEIYLSQLWSLGQSYVMLKELGRERDLLAPLIVFQVRGSVSASGGHDPEALLRSRFQQWGLLADIDYNLADAVLEKTSDQPIPIEGEQISKVRKKTRAYDFILPFKTPTWHPRIFIQSQFYAGDSGSVSHKNVDQTTSSRSSVLDVIPEARFVEYLDGAGYFSSLNGDLKTLLSMPSTRSFFQVRSAAIRLRRELQDIGFLTPLEIEHACLLTDSHASSVKMKLQEYGYNDSEIERGISSSIGRNLLHTTSDNKILVSSERKTIARRYLLLDLIANLGSVIDFNGGRPSDFILIPGYGPLFGMERHRLADEAGRIAPSIRADLSKAQTLLDDIVWLCDEGLAMT